MQIELFISKEYLKNFINDFLRESGLIVFCKNKKEIVVSDTVTDNMLSVRDFILHIGNVECYDKIKKELHTNYTAGGKDGFIYLYCEFYPNEEKIVNSTIIWSQTNEDEKFNGKKLFNKIKKEFTQGLVTEDEQYSAYNEYLKKYYWANDVLEVKDKLYKSDGMVKVKPILPNS